MSEADAEEWRYVFGDKIILVGDTWEVTHDKFNTPMGSVYGVEIIADTIHTLMNGAPLRPASILVESASTLLFLGALLATSLLASLGARIAAVLGIYVIYAVAVSAIYIYLGTVISMVYAMLAGFLVVIAMSIRLFVIS